MTRSETSVARRKLDIRPTILLLGMMTLLAVASCDSTDSPGPGPASARAPRWPRRLDLRTGGSSPPHEAPGPSARRSRRTPRPMFRLRSRYVESIPPEVHSRETGTLEPVTPLLSTRTSSVALSDPQRFRLDARLDRLTGRDSRSAAAHEDPGGLHRPRPPRHLADGRLEVSPATWEPAGVPATGTRVVDLGGDRQVLWHQRGRAEAATRHESQRRQRERSWTGHGRSQEYDVTFTTKRPPRAGQAHPSSSSATSSRTHGRRCIAFSGRRHA